VWLNLLRHGHGADRLHACRMLVAWGMRDGLLTLIDWATEPETVPWAQDGSIGDDAFVLLTEALGAAPDPSRSEVAAGLRVAAARALLLNAYRLPLGDTMDAVLADDEALAAAVAAERAWADRQARATSWPPEHERLQPARPAAPIGGQAPPGRPPRWLAIDDRPTRLDRTAPGATVAFALDLRTGAFVRDDAALGRLDAGGPAVDELTEEHAARLVAELQRLASYDRQATSMTWIPTGDPAFPYRAELDRATYTLRANDFPIAPNYSLVVDGQDVDHLDAWPPGWERRSVAAKG
jgi:hypothetical protein